MIFDTTYDNKEYTRISNNILGKPYSLFEKIKLKGIGSGKFVIAEKSHRLDLGQSFFEETNHANIELRPKGIIIHYSNKYQRFAWIIPFYKLTIYSSQHYSIHSDGNYLKFEKDKHFKMNKKFLNKMMHAKVDYLDCEYYAD